MQTYTLPLTKIKNYIGQIGGVIFEEYLKKENIFVIAKEYHISTPFLIINTHNQVHTYRLWYIPHPFK